MNVWETGGCLWECRQFSSTQNEPYGRGEIVQQLIDRGWFHYLTARPGKLYVWETLGLEIAIKPMSTSLQPSTSGNLMYFCLIKVFAFLHYEALSSFTFIRHFYKWGQPIQSIDLLSL